MALATDAIEFELELDPLLRPGGEIDGLLKLDRALGGDVMEALVEVVDDMQLLQIATGIVDELHVVGDLLAEHTAERSGDVDHDGVLRTGRGTDERGRREDGTDRETPALGADAVTMHGGDSSGPDSPRPPADRRRGKRLPRGRAGRERRFGSHPAFVWHPPGGGVRGTGRGGRPSSPAPCGTAGTGTCAPSPPPRPGSR